MTCPPGIVNASLESVFGTYTATLKASTDFWAGALRRRSSPVEIGLDLLQWYSAVLGRERPTWATPNQVVHQWPIARLRDFSTSGAGDQIATLILPPQAGHDSCIVDYAPGQSQIATAQLAGLTRVFSLDWIGATEATKDASIDDYLAVLLESVQRLGGLVNLVGDCQGGWLAVIYAALYPDTVHTLTIAGAPVDFRSGEPLIADWMRLLSPSGDLHFYRSLVAANGGVMPGDYMLAGFVAMQPDVEIDRQLQLLAHVGEPEHLQRYRTFENWFKHTQPIPGTFYLWIVEHLFQNNELIAGTLTIGDRSVDLSQITAPLYLLAGGTDHITPAPQVFALADFAGTDPRNVDRRLASGGHLGLFMGHESLRQHWQPVFASIAQRSVVAG
jgi:poly(3-hydroxybutyrate) depolymerase